MCRRRSSRWRAGASRIRRITFQVVEPEQPLPFPDASFDVVFTKDAWLHVLDKPALLREVHRVLKPGGQLAGGDWMKGPEPSQRRHASTSSSWKAFPITRPRSPIMA